jgi:hypothetical protein
MSVFVGRLADPLALVRLNPGAAVSWGNRSGDPVLSPVPAEALRLLLRRSQWRDFQMAAGACGQPAGRILAGAACRRWAEAATSIHRP